MRHPSSERLVHRLATPAVWSKLVLGLVAVGAVYVSIASAPGTIGLLAAALALVMLAIAVIDWRSFIIPDWLNAAGFGLAIMHAAAQAPEAMLQAIAMAALRGVGLALVAGAWLDWLMIPIAIELAAFAALSAYLLRQLASGRSISATNRMPFGLFFAPAIWMCWLFETRWLESF